MHKTKTLANMQHSSHWSNYNLKYCRCDMYIYIYVHITSFNYDMLAYNIIYIYAKITEDLGIWEPPPMLFCIWPAIPPVLPAFKAILAVWTLEFKYIIKLHMRCLARMALQKAVCNPAQSPSVILCKSMIYHSLYIREYSQKYRRTRSDVLSALLHLSIEALSVFCLDPGGLNESLLS